MISALPTGVELTIQLSAPSMGRHDGSDVAVRILAGPPGSDPFAAAPLSASSQDLALESDEWRLVMHDFFVRVANMLAAPHAANGVLNGTRHGAGGVGVATGDGAPTRFVGYAADAFAKPTLVRSTPAPAVREAMQTSRQALARITIGELAIDIPAHRVTQRGRPVTLTRQEFALLLVLLDRAGEVVSREELRHELWDQDFPAGSRALDQCIFKLRRKLENDSRAPRYLHCIRGVGYRFDVAVPHDESPDEQA